MKLQTDTKKQDFSLSLAQKGRMVNETLSKLMDDFAGDTEPRLSEAMRYMLEGEGKRIRAAVVMWACETIIGEINDNARIAAASVEMVHTYSLIHDDLPAMDDDDLRRGKASCHAAFDEATAILTGDALLTMAFEVISGYIKEPQTAIDITRTLAYAAGARGMVAGQMADLESENKQGNIVQLEYIHINKTAKMFAASAKIGAIASEKADNEQAEKMYQFGLNLGLGFQVRDDLLDLSASTEQLGKTAGKDKDQGKVTYPGVVGVEKSKQIAEMMTSKALKELEFFGGDANMLAALTSVLLERDK